MEKSTAPIGKYAPDFELPGVDDRVHHLARYLEQYRAIGVVFICNHCPYVGLYIDRLKQIQTEFQDRGFTLIGINANDTTKYPEDSFEKMKDFAADRQLNFPYLRDPTQDVAHSFDAKVTPHAFVLDEEGKIRYGGAIDDNADAAESVRAFYFRDAIAQLLSNAAITPEITEPIGCTIKWRV